MKRPNHVIINGTRFRVYGVVYDELECNMFIRPQDDQTMDDVKNAVEAGEAPIEVYDSEDKLLYTLDDYHRIVRFLIDYDHKYSMYDIGLAFNVVLGKDKITSSDITDIQLALAELAGMIGGSLTW